MQSVRTAGQKQLTGVISPFAATMVRYLYGLPFALGYLAVLASQRDALPSLNVTFLIAGFLAGVLQIIATVLLIHLMTMRNFAVGSTYVRTEIVLTAMIGFLFFAEDISPLGWLAVLICVAGVMTINVARSGAVNRFWNLSAAYGLGAGLAFALTSLLIRKASLSFGIDDSALTAAMTLSYMVTLQTIITVLWVAFQAPRQFAPVRVHWRLGLFVGMTSVCGSIGWFTAMTLELASYVKTLGQIEFLITVVIGWFYFKERPRGVEWLGMLLILGAALLLLLASH